MKYKVGQLVVNKKLGLGKVLEVHNETVLVFFKDESVNPRTINVTAMPMDIAEDQRDPAFSDSDNIERMKRPTKKAAPGRRISRRPGHGSDAAKKQQGAGAPEAQVLAEKNAVAGESAAE